MKKSELEKIRKQNWINHLKSCSHKQLDVYVNTLAQKHTQDELDTNRVIHKNHVGFNAPDFKKCIWMASMIQDSRWLKLRHYDYLRKTLIKYRKQLNQYE